MIAFLVPLVMVSLVRQVDVRLVVAFIRVVTRVGFFVAGFVFALKLF